MLVGVLPQREGASRITSAFSSVRTLWPSSCSMVNSIAAIRLL